MLYKEESLRQSLENLAQDLNIKIVWIQNWNGDREPEYHPTNDRLFILPECDHDALFPQVDAVLHHGGSGTVHSAARHGKPQLIAWFMLDQSFWAAQMESLGLGINQGAFQELNAEKLMQSLRLVKDGEAMAAKCTAAAQGMAQENGVGSAIEQIFD